MLKLYYRVWVDAIVRIQSIPTNRGYWKFYSLAVITLANAVNIMLLSIIFQEIFFHKIVYDLNVQILHGVQGQKFNDFVSFFILFALVPLCVNYWLIFRNRRYEELLATYKPSGGKLAMTYLLISCFSPITIAAIAYFIKKLF